MLWLHRCYSCRDAESAAATAAAATCDSEVERTASETAQAVTERRSVLEGVRCEKSGRTEELDGARRGRSTDGGAAPHRAAIAIHSPQKVL